MDSSELENILAAASFPPPLFSSFSSSCDVVDKICWIVHAIAFLNSSNISTTPITPPQAENQDDDDDEESIDIMMSSSSSSSSSSNVVALSSSPQSRVKCRFCSTRWASINCLRRHEREFHTNEMLKEAEAVRSGQKVDSKIVICDICGRPFCSRTALATHRSRSVGCSYGKKREKKLTEEEHQGKVFQCRYCPTACSAMTSLRIHERHHHGDKLDAADKPNQCLFCMQRFASLRGLNFHMTRSTGCQAKRAAAISSQPSSSLT